MPVAKEPCPESSNGFKLLPKRVKADVASKLPSNIRQIGDNYNHLHEQPTAFYAVAIAIALSGHGDGIQVQLAWAYVVLRIIHSLIQSIYNNVMHRFITFFVSGILIGAMAIIEILNWI
jgi:hypothetical protein